MEYVYVLRKETKFYMFKNKTKKSVEYQEIEDEVNSSISKLNNNQITVGHCIDQISPYNF